MVDDAEEGGGGGGTRAPSMQRSYGSSLAPFTQIRSTGYELLGLNREHRQEYPNEKNPPLQPDLRPPPQKRINKYALSCALLASMNSTLLGYGKLRREQSHIHTYDLLRPPCLFCLSNLVHV